MPAARPSPAGHPARPARRRTVASAVVGVGLAVLGLAGCTGSGTASAGGAGSATSPTGPSDGVRSAAVSAGQSDCGAGWSGGPAGTWRLDATNTSTGGMDVVVADDAADMTKAREYLELEAVGPGASAGGEVTLAPGSYRVVCVQADEDPVLGPVVHVTGALPAGRTATPGIVAITQADLVPAAQRYEAWVTTHLATLSRQVRALDDDVAHGDLTAARRDWLTAHSTYGTLGGAYDAFGDLGDAIDGLPATGTTALADDDLTGFRRIEALLWADRSAGAVRPLTRGLVKDVAALRKDFPAAQVDPMDLGIRAHEILEDAVQVQLSGGADGASGTTLAEIEAGVVGTRQPLAALRPLLTARDVDLGGVDDALGALEHTLRGYDRGGRWTARTDLTAAQRERLDAEVDTCVERLATVAALTDPPEGPVNHVEPATADHAPAPAAAGPGRRTFLRSVAGAAGVVGLGALAPRTAHAATADPTAATTGDVARDVPFHGPHQAGILTPLQKQAAFLALDVTATSRTDLEGLFRTLTDRARFLTTGGTPTSAGPGAPPVDSGVLGPDVVAGGLSITTSVGASLFDHRFGLADRKPARLRAMDTFPDDSLDRARCDGDLLLQVCADDVDVVVHAVRDIARATRGAMQVRWRQDGFASPPRPSGTPRNLMGFKDGTANPSTDDANAMGDVVWTQAGRVAAVDGLPAVVEPAWTTGGSYHVVRLIRMLVEFWDRVSLHEQENMIGRRRDTGAPLTGTHEFDDPHLERDPTGDAIQMDAHIRLANPRSPGSDRLRMLRRPYNYDAGTDANGNLDMGLAFVAFNQDLDRQFVAVQKRLEGEPLVDYISPFGGGYFFALPGVRAADDWYASRLLA